MTEFNTSTHRVCCNAACEQGRSCPNRQPSGPSWIGEVIGFIVAAAIACLAVYVILWPKV